MAKIKIEKELCLSLTILKVPATCEWKLPQNETLTEAVKPVAYFH